MSRRRRAREAALQLLYQNDLNPTVDRQAIEQFARDRLAADDLCDFCLQLFDRVDQHRKEIDEHLAHAAENWRIQRMSAVDRNILRLGACELLFTSDVPPRVVMDEAVEIARRYGSADSPAFVNGVLDCLHRSRANLISKAAEPNDKIISISNDGAGPAAD